MSERVTGFAEVNHCDSFNITMVIPENNFSISTFAKQFPSFGELPSVSLDKGVEGPLRFPEAETLSVSAALEFHTHSKEKHYWVLIRALTKSKPSPPDASWPTVEDFERALGEAMGGSTVSCRVAGRHRFARSDWEGVLALPVTLPIGESGVQAQLTGVQVTYEGPDGRQVVLLSARDDSLTAATDFYMTVSPRLGFVKELIERSCAVAKRNLSEIEKSHAE